MTDSPYPKPKPMAAIQFGPGIVLAGSGWIVYRRDRRRALWLNRMGGINQVSLPFLHTFYYQTLARSHRRRGL